ncbi:unnamed protein product [Phytophthora fragariaefolia]|uniref:Unnamed protein product n=1 Tax=Phytophthora fragariaefolia TaxID=1490495 RepID=A0A9W6X5V7_9STRA|nr:unnamed protein product [Phytophthora fragariaefolia]
MHQWFKIEATPRISSKYAIWRTMVQTKLGEFWFKRKQHWDVSGRPAQTSPRPDAARHPRGTHLAIKYFFMDYYEETVHRDHKTGDVAVLITLKVVFGENKSGFRIIFVGRFCTYVDNSSPRSQAEQPASTPLSTAMPLTKRRRKNGGEPHVSFVELKQAQLAQNQEMQLMELQMRKKQVSLQEQELNVRQQQMDTERRAIDARIEEANAQALKFRQEAEHWRQQRVIALL